MSTASERGGRPKHDIQALDTVLVRKRRPVQNNIDDAPQP
jgi:hypothetical protein